MAGLLRPDGGMLSCGIEEQSDVLHTAGTNHAVALDMRGLAILLVAILVLSAMVPGQPHFSPQPTGPMPAVNVP